MGSGWVGVGGSKDGIDNNRGGEPYVSEEVSEQLLAAAEEAARSGVLVDVREYTAAMV